MAASDPLFSALAAFAKTLAQAYEISDVLLDLTERVTQVVDVPTAGVSLVEDGRLRHVTSHNESAALIETAQEQAQRGPCVDASRSNEIVTVTDLREGPDRWPEVQDAALATGVQAVACIPFSVGDRSLGALNLYDFKPRLWSSGDLDNAGVLADIATGYLANASRLQLEHRINEQMQRALDSRIIIEQAKGILASHNDISVSQAFQLIRAHARSHNASVRAVADAVVNLGLRLNTGPKQPR